MTAGQAYELGRSDERTEIVSKQEALATYWLYKQGTPEALLEACRAAVGFAVDFRERHPDDWQEFQDVVRLFVIATAAISRAKGRAGDPVPESFLEG
jgi:hypothetical protein